MHVSLVPHDQVVDVLVLVYTEVSLSCLCSCRQTFSLLAVMGIGGSQLGNFGSVVKVSAPITSTTELFNPQKFLLGTPALPNMTGTFLQLPLIKEVLKHREGAWKAALIENECIPQHKLLAASSHVKHPQLQLAFPKMLHRFECV